MCRFVELHSFYLLMAADTCAHCSVSGRALGASIRELQQKKVNCHRLCISGSALSGNDWKMAPRNELHLFCAAIAANRATRTLQFFSALPGRKERRLHVRYGGSSTAAVPLPRLSGCAQSDSGSFEVDTISADPQVLRTVGALPFRGERHHRMESQSHGTLLA